jgi:hypothetical protein
MTDTSSDRLQPESKFLDVIGKKSFRCFLLAIHSHLYLRILLPPKSGLKLVCNVNIVYGNLTSENSYDYAQKPQQNYTFMNSASAYAWSNRNYAPTPPTINKPSVSGIILPPPPPPHFHHEEKFLPRHLIPSFGRLYWSTRPSHFTPCWDIGDTHENHTFLIDF